MWNEFSSGNISCARSVYKFLKAALKQYHLRRRENDKENTQSNEQEIVEIPLAPEDWEAVQKSVPILRDILDLISG